MTKIAEGTYDDHQLAAKLITCPQCGKRYYLTQNWGPRDICLECQPFEPNAGRKAPRLGMVDVNGHAITGP